MNWLTRQPTERLIGFAQIFLSVVFLVGYFVLLGIFLLGLIRTPAEWKDALTALLGVLTAGVGTIMGFWFSRSRPAGMTETQ
jgi:hypothetical protein